MLKKSPKWFGDLLFPGIYIDDEPSRRYFYEEFQILKQEEQQVVIDFIQYKLEDHPEEKDREYHQTTLQVLTECLRISGLQGGNSRFFKEYM